MSKNKKKKSKGLPLNRWRYFTKTLYGQSNGVEFTYEKVIYYKSEALMDIEYGNKRINAGLLLALFATFYFATELQNVWLVVAYFFLVVAGQAARLLRLPKDIMAHLEDSGRRQR